MFKRSTIRFLGFLFVFVFYTFTLMALLSQEYNPFLEPMSNLGMGTKGIFFNLGLTFSGFIGTLVVYGRYRHINKILTILGAFAMLSLSLVGIFPKPMILIHGLFTGMMFAGMGSFFIYYIIVNRSLATLIMLILFAVFPFCNINLSEWIIFFAVNGWIFVRSTKFHSKISEKYANL